MLAFLCSRVLAGRFHARMKICSRTCYYNCYHIVATLQQDIVYNYSMFVI